MGRDGCTPPPAGGGVAGSCRTPAEVASGRARRPMSAAGPRYGPEPGRGALLTGGTGSGWRYGVVVV